MYREVFGSIIVALSVTLCNNDINYTTDYYKNI